MVYGIVKSWWNKSQYFCWQCCKTWCFSKSNWVISFLEHLSVFCVSNYYLVFTHCLITIIDRSIGTGLALSATFLLIFMFAAVLPDTPKLWLNSAVKGLSPILTAIANFGKIQDVALLYWKNFANFRSAFKVN